MKEEGIMVGRDRFFKFLKKEGLLVQTKRRYYKTTNSRHWMRRYPNCIRNLELHRPEQLWVADITYVKAQNKYYYLHLITDAYSKRIVGWCLSTGLHTIYTLKALKEAVSKRLYDGPLIHHSDRGLQYCSELYTRYLKDHNIGISMTENSDPYENAIAERINGILKIEFNLDYNFKSYKDLKKNVEESVYLYNHKRIHTSIQYLTPNQAHLQESIKLKQYKKNYIS